MTMDKKKWGKKKKKKKISTSDPPPSAPCDPWMSCLANILPQCH